MERNALGVVLQLSRLVGVAPYVRGTEYQVSRATDICGKIVLTLTCTTVVIGLINHIVLNKEATLLTTEYFRAAAKLFTVVVALSGSLTAAGRMRRIRRILKQLVKIDLNVRRRGKISNRKVLFYVLIYMTACLIVRVLYNILNYNFIDHQQFVLQLINLVNSQIVTILELQLVTLAARVLLTLETINLKLEELIPGKKSTPILDIKPTVPRVAWENIGNFKRNLLKFNRNTKLYPKGENKLNVDSSDANVELKIRQLANHYMIMCEIVRTITKEDGFLMILLLVYHMINLELSWHQIIIWCSKFEKTYSFSFLLYPALFGTIHAIALFFGTEPFHQTHVQMNRTHLAINYLKCRSADDVEVTNELELFVRLLLLNKSTYSPLSVCTLSRPLVVKIFGSLVTYLVIILTYGPEMRLSSHVLSNQLSLV